MSLDDITLTDIVVFLSIWFIFLGLMAVVVRALAKRREKEDLAQPIKRKMAKVVDMQRLEAGQMYIGEPWVMFEFSDGSRLRLNAKQNNSLIIGDIGLLTWQGRKILTFERKIEK